ncbi:hypothetical protein F5B19DRAFT_440247 [Rostrohypoxylon terebratum]|nr:hypothetical protein F5B19DRAFT_440247 [Rostrohypoxylon terebratum]
MKRWTLARGSICSILLGLRGWKLSWPRRFSVAVNDVERVRFRNGISGLVTIDLHNVARASSPDPLLIYLPPYSTAFSDGPVALPTFAQRRPTAVINYRWAGYYPFGNIASRFTRSGRQFKKVLSWPTPLHDILKGYDWIKENLGPDETRARWDIYVYGSYLGASLATSLALTETHFRTIQQIGIRGCVAYNGIYNWTTFLPDHKINQASLHPPENTIEEVSEVSSEEPQFQELKQHMKALFVKPDNLFDPFASSSLFFHPPGLYVPPNFNSTALSPENPEDLERDPLEEPVGDPTLLPVDQPRFISEDPDLWPEDEDEDEDKPESSLGKKTEQMLTKPPNAGYYKYPPRWSTLEIPEALLLYSSQSPLPASLPQGLERPPKLEENNFKSHASDLAKLMRRSINKIEMVERAKRGESVDISEAARRVQLEDVGLNPGGFELGREGEELVGAWLEDQMDNSYPK